MKAKRKLSITLSDYIKANRKASREAEIENHQHPICHKRVHQSKKAYSRKRSKAEMKKALPYLFIYVYQAVKCRVVALMLHHS